MTQKGSQPPHSRAQRCFLPARSFATPRARAHSARPALVKGTRAAIHRHVGRNSPLMMPFPIPVPGRPRHKLSPVPCPQSPPPARALGSESSAHILPVTSFLCTPWGSWASQQDHHPWAPRIGGMSPHHGHWFSCETWNLLVNTSVFRLGQDAGMYRLNSLVT